jgi:phosphomevalonate kinase
VLAVRAAAAAQGRALRPADTLSLALAAHWAEQGGSGSGADVAASALGGLSLVRVAHHWTTPEALLARPARSLVERSPLEVHAVALPADLRLLLAFSGQSADTRHLVRDVRLFAAARKAAWDSLAERIAACAGSLAAALEAAARDPGAAPREAALASVRAAAAAMGALGDEAKVPIVTDPLARICAVASSAGAAAKPSGAGGGDCAVVLAFGDAAIARAEERLRALGVPALRVAVAVDGRVEGSTAA